MPPHYPRPCWHPLRLDPYGSDAYNAIVTFHGAEGSWNIENLLKLPEGTQPQITPGELLACEAVVKNDARVQALAKEVGELTLPSIRPGGSSFSCLAGIEPHQIFADGWSIGYDDRFPTSLRLQQALLFARFSQHENLYAHPLVLPFLSIYRTCTANDANRTLSPLLT